MQKGGLLEEAKEWINTKSKQAEKSKQVKWIVRDKETSGLFEQEKE